jgi:hypothetical protein
MKHLKSCQKVRKEREKVERRKEGNCREKKNEIGSSGVFLSYQFEVVRVGVVFLFHMNKLKTVVISLCVGV